MWRGGMGGHVREGLEDNLFIARGVLAKSNTEQVHKVRAMVEALGREVATPREARHAGPQGRRSGGVLERVAFIRTHAIRSIYVV